MRGSFLIVQPRIYKAKSELQVDGKFYFEKIGRNRK